MSTSNYTTTSRSNASWSASNRFMNWNAYYKARRLFYYKARRLFYSKARELFYSSHFVNRESTAARNYQRRKLLTTLRKTNYGPKLLVEIYLDSPFFSLPRMFKDYIGSSHVKRIERWYKNGSLDICNDVQLQNLQLEFDIWCFESGKFWPYAAKPSALDFLSSSQPSLLDYQVTSSPSGGRAHRNAQFHRKEKPTRRYEGPHRIRATSQPVTSVAYSDHSVDNINGETSFNPPDLEVDGYERSFSLGGRISSYTLEFEDYRAYKNVKPCLYNKTLNSTQTDIKQRKASLEPNH